MERLRDTRLRLAREGLRPGLSLLRLCRAWLGLLPGRVGLWPGLLSREGLSHARLRLPWSLLWGLLSRKRLRPWLPRLRWLRHTWLRFPRPLLLLLARERLRPP